MSTDVATPSAATGEPSKSIPLGRLISVEFRKTYDTLAGFWLLMTTAILIVATVTIVLIVGAVNDDVTLNYGAMIQAVAIPCTILLPIMGIMLVTSEWSQRTAMYTFALEPRRVRVVFAKFVVGIIWSLVTAAASLGFGALANLINISLDSGAGWAVDWKGIVGFVLGMCLAMFSGFALACLFLNTPVAIVVYLVYTFVFPMVFAAAAFVKWLADFVPWIDWGQAQSKLYDLEFQGDEFAQFVTSGLLWLVLPLVLGVWRILRAEVK